MIFNSFHEAVYPIGVTTNRSCFARIIARIIGFVWLPALRPWSGRQAESQAKIWVSVI